MSYGIDQHWIGNTERQFDELREQSERAAERRKKLLEAAQEQINKQRTKDAYERKMQKLYEQQLGEQRYDDFNRENGDQWRRIAEEVGKQYRQKEFKLPNLQDFLDKQQEGQEGQEIRVEIVLCTLCGNGERPKVMSLYSPPTIEYVCVDHMACKREIAALPICSYCKTKFYDQDGKPGTPGWCLSAPHDALGNRPHEEIALPLPEGPPEFLNEPYVDEQYQNSFKGDWFKKFGDNGFIQIQSGYDFFNEPYGSWDLKPDE